MQPSSFNRTLLEFSMDIFCWKYIRRRRRTHTGDETFSVSTVTTYTINKKTHSVCPVGVGHNRSTLNVGFFKPCTIFFGYKLNQTFTIEVANQQTLVFLEQSSGSVCVSTCFVILGCVVCKILSDSVELVIHLSK